MAASGWFGWYYAENECAEQLQTIEEELQQDQIFPCGALLDVCLRESKEYDRIR